MRRWLGMLQIGALTAVLCCGVAQADAVRFTPPAVNLGAKLFARLFGESSDRLASYSAVSGDESAESPLRNLALRFDVDAVANARLANVQLPTLDPSIFESAHFDGQVVNVSDAAYAPSTPKAPSIGTIEERLRIARSIEYYQSARPEPTDAPLSQRFDLGHMQLRSVRSSAFTLAAPDPSQTIDFSGASVKLPGRLGHMRFSTHAQAGEDEASLNDRSLAAGATIDVHAFRRNVGVDVSSALEHVTLSQPEFSPSSASVGLAGESLPVFVPAYADVSAHTISTGVTVPVSRSLTANLQYDTQHLLGAYGAPGLSGLDASNTIYGAQLTFQLPRSASAISLSAKQYHYQDNLVPANAVTQTNANLNFTVKF